MVASEIGDYWMRNNCTQNLDIWTLNSYIQVDCHGCDLHLSDCRFPCSSFTSPNCCTVFVFDLLLFLKERKYVYKITVLFVCMNASVCASVSLFTVDQFFWIFGVNGTSSVLTPSFYICNLWWAVKWWTRADTGNIQPWVQTWCDVPDRWKIQFFY